MNEALTKLKLAKNPVSVIAKFEDCNFNFEGQQLKKGTVELVKEADNTFGWRELANGADLPKLGQKLNVSDYATSAKNSVLDKMTPYHILSFAATQKSLETKLGRSLTVDEAKKFNDEGTTILYETTIHQKYSRTYGGRNTSEQIINDSQKLFEAAKRDMEALRIPLLESGMTEQEINKAFELIHEMNRKNGLY